MTTILQIIPSMGSGGAEQATLDVAAGLVAAGHRALVVSSGGRLVAELEKLGVTHITHPVQSKKPWQMLANARWLAELIRREKVDIVHARSRAPAWSTYWASGITKCHFVTTFHAAYKFNNGIKHFYNSVMAKGERIIAISDFIAQHIRETYGVDDEVIRTIPRSIDLAKFDPALITDDRRVALRAAWGIGANEKVVLLPARLSPIKGHRIFLQAFAQLPAALRDTAIVVGDDQGRVQYRNELVAMIATLGLEDSVRLVGHCADMPAAYSLARLIVAPSLVQEGFGRTPIEAMAMGVPVVASDLGGYRETIHPNAPQGANGWLYPAEDVAKFAEAMREALQQNVAEQKIMLHRAMQEARSLYDKNKMVTDTLAVYGELAGAN